LVFIEQMFRQGMSNDLIPSWLMNQNQVGSVRFILVGVALMLLMIYRPQGIFGDKKELALNARA
jgi:ABC-type branched-subunit amino acid transport system permease subunit